MIFPMRPSLYEAAGGMPAFQALAKANHERCLADPELNHPFSKTKNPRHVEALAAYWAEAMGGPPTYSTSLASETRMQQLHAGNGEGMRHLAPRFVACFVQAMDDAKLPADPELRKAMRDYITWATENLLVYIPKGTTVPAGLRVPKWSWDGLVSER